MELSGIEPMFSGLKPVANNCNKIYSDFNYSR